MFSLSLHVRFWLILLWFGLIGLERYTLFFSSYSHVRKNPYPFDLTNVDLLIDSSLRYSLAFSSIVVSCLVSDMGLSRRAPSKLLARKSTVDRRNRSQAQETGDSS